MPTPTKRQKECFETILEEISLATPITIENWTYKKRISYYNKILDDIRICWNNRDLTDAQYKKLMSRLMVFASYIVETPIKKGKYWNY